MSTLTIGYIGLGDQGAPLARLIAQDPALTLRLWARRPESLAPFADVAQTHATPRDLGAACDAVGVCVTNAEAIFDVALGDDGLLAGMRPGSVLIVNSTISPADCAALAEAAAARDVLVVDAPVSRATHGPTRFTCLVGGDDAAVEAAMPLLNAIGDHVTHLGPLGSGQRAKVINNILLLANMRLALDSFDLAARLGLDRAAFEEVLQHCSGRSFASRSVLALDQTGADVPGLMAKELGILRGELGPDTDESSWDVIGVAEGLLDQMLARPWEWAPRVHPRPTDAN